MLLHESKRDEGGLRLHWFGKIFLTIMHCTSKKSAPSKFSNNSYEV